MTSLNIFPPEGDRRSGRYLAYLGLLMILFVQGLFSQSGNDPFYFFRPSIVITRSERAQLDDGQPFYRVLPAKGNEIAVLAAVPVGVDGDRLLAWERQIEELKSPYAVAIGRFSDPPRIEDLAGLELDSGDVAAIRSCRPRNCQIKLSAAEMQQLQDAEAHANGDPAAGVQQEFRHIVLSRVEQYLANGHIPPDEDHREQVQRASRFELLLDRTPFLETRLPQLAEHLRNYPLNADSGVESFLYWSKERIARKPVISVTHLSIVRNDAPDLPDALIVGRDVFSTHYVDASLSVTALMRGDTDTMNYLVYVNRTEVDMLHGAFGGMIRGAIQSHLKNATKMLADLRKRLESGAPPNDAASAGPPRKSR
jgi:hypothetical protein